ncbi:MAG TPA: hypothetical protein VKR06_46535, partial [Ktedonosporobacter sp.]|nr:hypothetical protein [Ktedonosporobacter sp.]
AVFVTLKGVYAVRSEYYNAGGPPFQPQCILLASGEYAHFAEGENTQVREVQVEGFSMEDEEGEGA